MKANPNNTVSELKRLIPVLIAAIPPGYNTRVGNAIRLSKNLVKKLSTLKEIEYGN